MPRIRDMRNIRERIVWRNGRPETHYQVRLQVRDPVTRKLRLFVGTLDNENDARRWRDQMRAQGQLGDIGERDALSKAIQSLTLSDLVTSFEQTTQIRRMQKRQLTGWGSDEAGMLTAFKNREASRLCRKLVVDLTQTDFHEYVERRIAGGVKAATVARELNPVRVIFRYAAKHWKYPSKSYLFEGLFDDYDLNTNRERILKPEERFKLYRGIERRHSKQQRAMWSALVTTALSTAMRRGELLRLEWRDVDLKADTILVRREIAKNRKQRLLPISKSTHARLSHYQESLGDEERRPTDKVFPITPGAHEQAWRRICKDADIDHADLHFHDLRHTATTSFVSVVGRIRLDVPELNWMLKGKLFGDRILATYANPEVRDMVEGIRTKLNAAEETAEKASDGLMLIEVIASVRELLHGDDHVRPTWNDDWNWKDSGDGRVVIDPDGPKSKATVERNTAKREAERAERLARWNALPEDEKKRRVAAIKATQDLSRMMGELGPQARADLLQQLQERIRAQE